MVHGVDSQTGDDFITYCTSRYYDLCVMLLTNHVHYVKSRSVTNS